MAQLFNVVVKNKIKNGYRRSGISLHDGENTLNGITAEQLAALKADSRLVVQKVEAQSGENGGKGLPKNGQTTPTQSEQLSEGALPTDLTVNQLKAKLTELGIEIAKDTKKADLVALLEEATVNPKEGE